MKSQSKHMPTTWDGSWNTKGLFVNQNLRIKKVSVSWIEEEKKYERKRINKNYCECLGR